MVITHLAHFMSDVGVLMIQKRAMVDKEVKLQKLHVLASTRRISWIDLYVRSYLGLQPHLLSSVNPVCFCVKRFS